MKFKASAPGRCGIVGNPSDIYGGRVLSCSIPARATCTITLGDEGLPDDTTLWDAATQRLPVDGPVKVEWETDIPRSSGLAGSTALLAATVACLLAARSEKPTLDRDSLLEVSELVRDIEAVEAGVVCGYQDAYMVVHGGLQFMDFAGKHPVTGGPHGQMASLQAPLPLLLVTTGVERLSGSVHGPVRDRWLAGDREVIVKMEQAAKIADEGTEALLAGGMDSLADLMNDNQDITSSLGGSGRDIDKLIDRCFDNGADAAKLAGAGMGGTVIALATDLKKLERGLRKKGYTQFMRPEITPGLQYEDV
jgi:galactokinase/mevalonate kinase-like predicted kinase